MTEKETIHSQNERHQRERRVWQLEAIEENRKHSWAHKRATASVFRVLLLRAVIELGILVCLIVMVLR